ncbi:squalene/phytoene synthase family protein [Candidatus Vallotia cooleyia]|uniref:squalene/phytoene synthase family protein n=1 Tax=Candidatus Vallotiella adelgis TaxID=1177211 RepID=UPI001D02B90B|nr:squalene/phytoene synthase family protein [Candidatus Vallotia cooleyia]
MNIDDYCQKKAAPAGSSTYYALWRAPLTAQPLLTALYALHRELSESVSEVSDPTVGRIKLAWWQNEFVALAREAPTHPVTQVIARHYGNTAPIGTFMTWLSGYQMDLDQTRYLDFVGLHRYVEQVGAALANIVAGITAHEPTNLKSWAPVLGRALLLADIVERTGENARCGRIYIPTEEMQRFGVTATDIQHCRYSKGYIQLMSFQVSRARRMLNEGLGAMPATERKLQRVLRAQAAMSLALLHELEIEDYRVLCQRIALTPLRKLWIAWRIC